MFLLSGNGLRTTDDGRRTARGNGEGYLELSFLIYGSSGSYSGSYSAKMISTRPRAAYFRGNWFRG